MGHAIDRAKERWEIDLTKEDLYRVREAFRAGDKRLLQIEGWFDGYGVFAARLRGTWLPIVLAGNGYAVTVLGRDSMTTPRWRAIHAHRKELKRIGIDPDLDADQSRERNAG